MLSHFGFLVAGFFWPVWPWGPVAAFGLQALGMILTRERYRVWLQRPPRFLAGLILGQLGLTVLINSLLMLPGNLVRDLL